MRFNVIVLDRLGYMLALHVELRRLLKPFDILRSFDAAALGELGTIFELTFGSASKISAG